VNVSLGNNLIPSMTNLKLFSASKRIKYGPPVSKEREAGLAKTAGDLQATSRPTWHLAESQLGSSTRYGFFMDS
jgi:hypothetical protein